MFKKNIPLTEKNIRGSVHAITLVSFVLEKMKYDKRSATLQTETFVLWPLYSIGFLVEAVTFLIGHTS